MSLTSPVAIEMAILAYPPSRLEHTVAGRIEQVEMLLNWPVVAEDGTVEYVALISREQAAKLLDGL